MQKLKAGSDGIKACDHVYYSCHWTNACCIAGTIFPSVTAYARMDLLLLVEKQMRQKRRAISMTNRRSCGLGWRLLQERARFEKGKRRWPNASLINSSSETPLQLRCFRPSELRVASRSLSLFEIPNLRTSHTYRKSSILPAALMFRQPMIRALSAAF